MTHQISATLTGLGTNNLARLMPEPRRPKEVDTNKMLAATATEVAKKDMFVPVYEKDLGTAVVYSIDSMDSMYAAALYISAFGRKNDIRAIGYSDDIPYKQLTSFGKVIMFAPGKVDPKFVEYLNRGRRRLDIYTYRGMLTYLDGKSLKKTFWRAEEEPTETSEPIFKMHRPSSDESFGKLSDMVSDTMIDMVHALVYGLDRSPALKSMTLAAKRMVSMAYPVTNDPNIGLGEAILDKDGKFDATIELGTKAQLHDLMPKIATALRSHHPAHALDNIQIADNIDAYLTKWKDNTITFARSASSKLYKVQNTKGLGIVREAIRATSEASNRKKHLSFWVKTMACTERNWLDMLTLAMVQSSMFIGYEDMHGVRLWRIYSKNPEIAMAIAASLNGKDVWYDGLSVRTFTRLEK